MDKNKTGEVEDNGKTEIQTNVKSQKRGHWLTTAAHHKIQSR